MLYVLSNDETKWVKQGRVVSGSMMIYQPNLLIFCFHSLQTRSWVIEWKKSRKHWWSQFCFPFLLFGCRKETLECLPTFKANGFLHLAICHWAPPTHRYKLEILHILQNFKFPSINFVMYQNPIWSLPNICKLRRSWPPPPPTAQIHRKVVGVDGME